MDYMSVSSLLPLSTSSSATVWECESWDNFLHKMDCPSMFRCRCSTEFLSSCNGLVWTRCISCGICEEEFYIWNLSTRSYKNIPMAPRQVNNDEVDGYGFGYDFKTEDYKLVRVASDPASSKCSIVDVYTLESNSWKCSQIIPYRVFENGHNGEGMLFNGSIHWLALSSEQGSTIVLICFDTVNERFEEVALLLEAPMPNPEEPEANMFNINLGILGGCICLVLHFFDVQVDVLTMQQYGANESWTKSFSITEKSITSRRHVELLWIFKNNEILWQVDQGFVLYDPINETYRKLMLDSQITGSLNISCSDDMVNPFLLN
ncbi:F-box/kelch-repeat protein At3g06240-like [Papaver somniferum]|uniref:F-box/kelch-repeat protein At3g06240-like n=1 Tax=Papaver somniferum TaxID=3469 RepID=UPI000E7040F2|nr:F-box/kelch-repeat protein At3g06240-like [Papaver somniferum]